MSLFSTLQTAVSGMSAQVAKLSTISDNIANQSTAGYKNADTEFSTLLGDSTATNYSSGGVQSNVRYTISTQGTVTTASSTTDLAVSGNGFFLVKTADGSTAMTRAGNFTADSSTGDLVNAAGNTLLGYSLTDGSYNATSQTGTLEAVSTANTSLVATPSTAATLSVNLPSTATAVTGTASPSNYTDMTTLVSYDKLGTATTLNVYMSKTSDNTWDVAVYNADDTTTQLADQTLTFDPTTGNLASGSATSLTVTPTSNSNAITIDMSKTTQLAADYNKGTQTIDGNAPSTLSSVSIGTDGTVTMNYASGATVAAYKIPLATVTSVDQLTSGTGNTYTANADSGAMVIGTANSGSFGSIESSSLESSTVDLATELSDMISTQRSYEANSKVLTTGSAMLSTLLQAIQ